MRRKIEPDGIDPPELDVGHQGVAVLPGVVAAHQQRAGVVFAELGASGSGVAGQIQRNPLHGSVVQPLLPEGQVLRSLQLLLQLRTLLLQRRQKILMLPLPLPGRQPVGHPFPGERGGDVLFDCGVEEREELIVLPVGNGVVLVGMATGAAHGESHERQTRGVGPVHHLLHPVLLRVHAALGIGERVAVKPGGRLLLHGGVRQQVAGQLFHHELVVGKVAVVGVDDPLAVAPGMGPHVVLLETVAVGVAGQVQPVAGPALPEVGRRQHPVDQPLVGVGTPVGKEALPLSRRGRQAHEIQVESSNQSGPAGLG